MIPKVTIMLSTYNGEKYLEEQLLSIYKQDCQCDLQIYVHDDGSSDSTCQILKKWEKYLKISYMDKGISYGAALSFWNLLKTVPESDYYAFMDQDDIWDSDKLKVAISAFNGIEKPVLWVSNCRCIDKNGNVFQKKMHLETPIFTVASQLICGSMQGCSMVFNADICKGLKKSNINIIPMHDIVVMIYSIIFGRVIYEPLPLFSYRQHSNNAVAKNGKTFFQKIKSTLILWFSKKNRNLTSKFASELLRLYGSNLDQATTSYLKALSISKYDFKSRVFIIKSSLTKSTNKKGLKSFKYRTLLGII